MHSVYDLPLTLFMGRKQIDGKHFADVIRSVNRPFGIRFAIIEDVNAMPKQGVVSMFRFGYNAGILLGVLQTLDIEILRVKPSAWKSALGLSSNKADSLALACKTFPNYKDYFQRAKDDGRAEAALLAHFASISF